MSKIRQNCKNIIDSQSKGLLFEEEITGRKKTLILQKQIH